MKLQSGGGAAWKGVQPGGTSPYVVHPRGFQLGGMKLKGLHPRGRHLEGSEGFGPHGAHLRKSPVRASSPRSTTEGLGAATSSGPSKDPMQIAGLGAMAARARQNASGSGLHPSTSSRTTANPGHGPAPKPSGPPWEAVRRQESVPGEMSLAPAGGRGGWGGSSGLLQAALSDSWPRREDCQGRDLIVDGKEGKEGGSCSLRQQLQRGGGGRDAALPPSECPVEVDILNLPHPPKTQRGHHGNNNLFK